MIDILTLQHVQKSFGTKQVIKDLDFSIPRGSIFGFVGENGAGKTTTMRMILGLEKVDSGTILVNGERVHYGQTKTNQITGYLPDVPAFYDYMTPAEYLRLCAQITKLRNPKTKIEETLELVGLKNDKRRIRGFSRGMRQRLGIAQALLNDPQLLICDEPTSALDPAGRMEFLDLLHSLKAKVTVLFSTHILSDVERISDRVGILNDGQLVDCDTITNLHSKYGHSQILIEFKTVAEAYKCAELLQAVQNEQQVTVTYQGDYATKMGELLQVMVANGLTPVSLNKMDATLDQIFMEVIKK